MSSNTSNLNLYKADPVADGNNTFNIQTMLNNNWDLIDLIIGSLSSLDTNTKTNIIAAINELYTNKANLASPNLTGIPTAPTATPNTNTTQLATTAFVQATIAALAGSTPTLMSTLQQIDAALNNDPNLYNDVMTAINNALSTSESYTNGLTGVLSSLSTTAKTNLVAAINEINASLSDYTKIMGAIDDTGSANTYIITLAKAPTTYAEYQTFRFKATNSNTGTSTLNVNDLGTRALVKDVNVALVTGDILAGQIVTAIFDGTNFQIVPDYNTQLGLKAPLSSPTFTGSVKTTKNTLDDGSGNVTIAGNLTMNGQMQSSAQIMQPMRWVI